MFGINYWRKMWSNLCMDVVPIALTIGLWKLERSVRSKKQSKVLYILEILFRSWVYFESFLKYFVTKLKVEFILWFCTKSWEFCKFDSQKSLN